ncbi:MAG: hypothetical protein IKU36_05595 [Bacteroidales bacterium]|nr:hypothetical protein [Bacteroidales bacterium]
MDYRLTTDIAAGYMAASAEFADMECHVMIEPYDKEASAAECVSCLENGLKDLLEKSLKGFRPVFKRWFLSDVACQRDLIPDDGICATSVVQQPPMNGSKAVLWIWMMKDVSERYTYSFEGNLVSDATDSYCQMKSIFEDYAESLRDKGLNVAEHCARTWIYVRDVDVNYAGIVKARRELFEEWGLKADTHYLASTGINGLTKDHRNLVSMDTYTVTGLEQNRIQYLHALENLSPTHIYGVTFERGTALRFEDRTQILISGTASIDKNGEIVAPGDITRQTERTFENINALLEEAGAGFEDIAHMIVYIRDTADYRRVESYISERFPSVPKIITWAPVCRPGWLVEVECVAYIKNND